MKSERLWSRCAIAYLAFLFAASVYRAATIPISTDEAFSYVLLMRPRPVALFRIYDASYHVLQTLLAFMMTKPFGPSEFALRIPSLAAAILYFSGVYRIARRLFGFTALFLLAVVLLTSNPLVLDYMSVARGYGMALAFFAWAFAESLVYRGDAEQDRLLRRIAILLGLSVASNLVFLFPSVALILVLSAITRAPRIPRTAGHLMAPAFATAFLFLALPLSHMMSGAFYFGATAITDTIGTLLAASFDYRTCNLGSGGTCDFGPLLGFGIPAVFAVFAMSLVATPLLFKKRDASGNFGLLTSAIFALTVCLVIASHVFLGVLYPLWRTGLYFLFLVPLCLLALCRWLWIKEKRPAAWAVTALLTLCCAYFLSEFNVRYYMEWPRDNSQHDVIAEVRRLHTTDHRMMVHARWPLAMSLAYEHDKYKLRWLNWIDKPVPEKGADAYLFRPEDAHYAADLGLRTVYVSKVSGTIVAVP